MTKRTKSVLSGVLAVAFAACFVGTATAATYTWTQGGDPTDWEDTGNWDANGVPPQDVAGTDLVFGPDTSGQIGSTPDTAKVTFGSMSWETSFTLQNLGAWTGYGALTVDTGDGLNTDATATFSNGADVTAYYVPWQLNSNLVLSGTGGNGGLTVRAYEDRVRGPGGFIVEAGTLRFTPTHGSHNYSYTGGVTVKNGGIVDVNSAMSALGDGLLTIEDGGVVQAANNTFDQDVLFDVNSSGTVDEYAFITGGGANWNASGEWSFDLADAGATAGDTWNIIDIGGTAIYDAEFSVAGFTESAGVWTGSANNAYYEFDESTGILQVTGIIPEPTSLALLGLGGLLIAGHRRRR